jgi:prevent-host-death family protein
VLARIGVRELRNSVAAVVRRAASGERLVVTVDGRPVAQLGPLEPDRRGVTVWDLAAAGLLEPPRRPDRPAAPPPLPVPADVRVDRLLEQVRGT